MNNDAVNAFCTASGVIIMLAGGMLLPPLGFQRFQEVN